MDSAGRKMNTTSNSTQHDFEQVVEMFRQNAFIYNQVPNCVLIVTYIPLFLIALSSNILVILVVSRYRCLRSVTNYFLVNLSVADLLVTLLCMPMAVGKAVTSLWLYGEIMCKLTHYLQGVAVSSSVFTITAMSIDRYLAIRHPMSRKIINRRTTRKVILLLWLIALLIFAPILYIRKADLIKIPIGEGEDAVNHEFTYCVEKWPDNLSRRTFGIFCFIIVYAIPGCVVVVAYSLMGLRLCSRQLLPEYQLTHGTTGTGCRNDLAHCDSANSAWQVSSAGGRLIRERRRVAKILLILALVFAFCWMPYSVLSLILDLKSPAQEERTDNNGTATTYDNEIASMATLLLPFAILLGHANSAVNPLLYCLLSKNFRRSVTELIRHPRRAVRGRQHCKIRMTFRREPAASADAMSSNNKPEQVSNRPRNHHTPEPTKAASIPYMDVEPAEICIVDMGNNNPAAAMVAYSPSSSGYSSLRQSTDTLAITIVNKENGHVFQHSTPHPFFASTANGVSVNGISNGSVKSTLSNGTTHHAPMTTSQAVVAILAKRCSSDGRKVHVPSTIREESDSCQSQKSKSNASIRAQVPG